MDSTSVISGVASVRPGAKGTVTAWPAFFAAASIAALPPSTMRSASETFFLPVWASLNPFCTFSRVASTLASCAGLLTSQSFIGARRMRAPLAPPRLSLPRKVAAEAQAVATSSEVLRPESRIRVLSWAMSWASTSSWSTAGTGSCQTKLCFGVSGPV